MKSELEYKKKKCEEYVSQSEEYEVSSLLREKILII
jgi:hypothetical protein